MKLVNEAKLRGSIIENGEIQYVHPGFPFVIRVEGDAVVLTRKKGPATGSSS